ncbi:MAG: haloacid dehalogenase-like hydrolase [Rhizobiaceae bacterium]|nr:haloacid dehalogenase-like hydrolase [Rhizobiaceae bacterium]
MKPLRIFFAASILAMSSSAAAMATDLLPSWQDGATKNSIISFVDKVTKIGGPDFIEPADRVAVFDNDGTLWSEQPIYFQLAFALDRVKALAPKHPEWKDTQPFKAVLENDTKALIKSGKRGLMELMMASHVGMSTDQFAEIVDAWISSAMHPKTGKLYSEMVFQPMIELLGYLRENGFMTYIVSGGGIEFMRPWTYRVYGVPPEQVIGSSVKVKYEMKDGNPVLTRLPEINFIDDKAGKPVGIHYHIGKRPVMAFGNSDGDFEMLEWTTSASGARFGLLVHHDDAKREYAYDRKSHIGQLDRGLDEAPKRGWSITSMKSDWKCIYKYQCQAK